MKITLQAIIVSFIIFFQTPCKSQNADINLLRSINEQRTPGADKFFLFITNSAASISFAGPLVIFTTGLITDEYNSKRASLEIAATELLDLSLTFGLKYLIDRPRPYETYDFINADVNGKEPGLDPSFPSGHTSLAFSFATSMSLLYPHWYVIVPSYLWACTVAYSRMYLGVHYPSDILGGILVGMGSAFLMHWVDTKISGYNQ